MKHAEDPDDSRLARELRDSLAEVSVPERPALPAIVSRGRVHRRRRLAGAASLGGSGAAGLIALVLGVAGVFGGAPARGTGPAHTAAFTLTSFTNGTVSLTLGQMFDPTALQRALAQHGIPALVRTGAYCSSRPAAPGLFRVGVLPAPRRAGPRPRGRPAPGGQYVMQSVTLPVKPSQLAPMVDPVSEVITPAAIPAGTELFIGFFNLGQTFFMDLVYTGSHTCSAMQEPPVAAPDGPGQPGARGSGRRPSPG